MAEDTGPGTGRGHRTRLVPRFLACAAASGHVNVPDKRQSPGLHVLRPAPYKCCEQPSGLGSSGLWIVSSEVIDRKSPIATSDLLSKKKKTSDSCRSINEHHTITM